MSDIQRLLSLASEDPVAATEAFRLYRRQGDLVSTQALVGILLRSKKYNLLHIARLLLNAGESAHWMIEDPQYPDALPLRDLHQPDHIKISPDMRRILMIAGFKIPLRWNEQAARHFNHECVGLAIQLLEYTFERRLEDNIEILLIQRLQGNQTFNIHGFPLINKDVVKSAQGILIDLSEDATTLTREYIQDQDINEEQYQFIWQIVDNLQISHCYAQEQLLISYYLGERTQSDIA